MDVGKPSTNYRIVSEGNDSPPQLSGNQKLKIMSYEILDDDWWIFQEYVEKLNNGETLSEDEEDELSSLEEEYDWDRYDCELM